MRARSPRTRIGLTTGFPLERQTCLANALLPILVLMAPAIGAAWLFGANVIEQRTITSSMYLKQAKDFVSEKILIQNPRFVGPLISYPRAGEKFTTVHPLPQGEPLGHGMQTVVWLAYCSGHYLKQDGRQIPMPFGPSSQAFGYSDKTVVFEDTLGLPKSVVLYATNGQLVCEYQVLQSTNFLGRIFPLKFRLVQHIQPANGGAGSGSKAEVLGRATSIQIGKEPKVPDEVQKKSEK